MGMKTQIVLIAALAAGTARTQSLIPREARESIRLMPNDAAVFDLQETRNDLACSASVSRPELGFDFLFHTRYEVSIPMKELSGAKNMLTIVMRVSPERRKDQPSYFVQKVYVPPIAEDTTGNAVLEGMFRLGEGRYHIEWLIRDMDERVCARFWDVEARAIGDDIRVTQAIQRDVIQPLDVTLFDEEVTPQRRPTGLPTHVKIIVNFASQTPEAAALSRADLQGLAGILRIIGRDPRIGSFSIVACSVQTQQVVYRQRNESNIDLPALGKALKSLSLGSVDAKQLASKNSETEFLARLITEEMRKDDPDAVIFVSPKYYLGANVSRVIVEPLRDSDHPVFYLNYNANPLSNPWRDAIGRVVKQLRGFEYTISRPRDLFNAWSDIMSRLAPGQANAVSAVVEP